MRRAKQYQDGYIQFDSRTDAWFFRWREGGKYRSRKIGTLRQYPTKSTAKRAAEPLRVAANKETVTTKPEGESLTFRKVIDAYIAEELPERHSTRRGYLAKLQNHIRPMWDDTDLTRLTAAEVEAWLKGLKLSGKTKVHLRSLLHILVDSAMRRGWLELKRNPLELVRVVGAARKKKRRGITLAQWKVLLAELSSEPMRTAVITCACLGLRCSELFALQWADFDWDAGTVTIQRGIVEGHVGELKTESSHDMLPVDEQLAATLFEWRKKTPFNAESDWVFASPQSGGAMPYPGRSLQQNWLTPAAVRVGIGSIGWHALRHTYRSLLGDSNTPMGVQQELMRHASIITTMNVYGSAVAETKRKAHSVVVNQLLQ
jgi:integrase